MGSADEYLGTLRSKHEGSGELLQGGGTVGYSLWVRDVGDDPLHGPDPGGVPK